MTATTLPYGVATSAGGRYHPVVVAQAVATVAEMFPGRFTVALGSGQALNEHVTGAVRPRKPVRNARLRECADIVRRLLVGEHWTSGASPRCRHC
jgi:alkanesulfonate monooxygenase SsuD/methylene tetrahydromethanopterin reductase-like flavin-dependent oxidoreductase (luciferase family)